jgi:hypothetical protein
MSASLQLFETFATGENYHVYTTGTKLAAIAELFTPAPITKILGLSM